MKGKIKYFIVVITVISILMSSMQVFVGATFEEVNTAITTGDFETADTLINTESVADPSLTVNASITVDEDTVVRDFNFNILGIQNEIMDYGDVFFKSYTNEFTDGFLEIADHIYDIPTARWGGATANTVGLLANIGPLEERQPSYGLAGTPKGNDSVGKIMSQPTDMGPVEFIKMIYAINPNASFMFVLPIDVQTAEESLNFTRFLLDDKNESEWGALRASLGIENPVNLLGYEIGNEEYFRAEPSMNSAEEGYDEYIVSDEYISYRDAAIDRYVNTCIANISAIHSVYPEVKMYPCVNGVTTRVSATAWNSAVATRICNQPGVDGVAYHAYYSTYATTTSTNTKQMDKIQNLFVTLTGEKTKFVYTEHALWSSDESVKRQSFYSALSEPYFINSMQMRDDVISANYHNIVCKSNLTSPGTWAFFTKKIDKYYENGINKVYKLYTENMGNKIVRSTTTIDSTHKSYISFLPTKKEDGTIVLSLTNYYADRNMNIDFTLNDEYELVKESVFTAPNFTSIVYGESTKDVFTVTNTYRGGETFSSYTLPNKSLAILTLKKKGSSYDENLTYTTNNILNETFESYSITPTPFTLVKDSGVNSVNAFGSWNLKTYVNVAYNENTKASIVEGKKLKLTPTAVAYTASGFPVLEYGGDLSSLTNYFKISFDYDKNSTTSGGGVKFMIHNSGRNYYVLWLSGLKEERYKWIFNKVENNTIVDTVYGETYTNYNDTPDLVKEAENGYLNGLVSANDKSYFLTNYSLNRGTVSPNNTKSGPIHNTGTVNIEYNNGKITWAIDGYEYNMIQYNSTGSYTDSSPFSVNANNTTVALGANSSTSNESRYMNFDNFKIDNYVPVTTELIEKTNTWEYPNLAKDVSSDDAFVRYGEPSGVIYIDRTVPYDTDMYYMPVDSPIRKIVNTGSETAKVYASTDDYSYKLIAEVGAGETFINSLSAKKFTYIKVEGGDVKIYTDLHDGAVLTAIEDVCDINARVGGSAENITYTSSNRNVAYIEDNKIIPLRNGTTTITASNGTESVSAEISVRVLTNLYEDFSSYEKDVTTNVPLGNAVRKTKIAGDWYFVQGRSGTSGSLPYVTIKDSGLRMNASGVSSIFSGYVGYMRYDGDYSGLRDKYTINVDYNMSSVMSGLGIRFNMFNNDSSYYMLMLSSGNNGSGYVWTFNKVAGLLRVYEQHGEEITAYNADQTGPLHGKGTVQINVDGNNISWTINGKRYNNRNYTATGSYTDDEPFGVLPRNTKMALVSHANKNTYYVDISKFEVLGEGDEMFISSPVTNGDLYVDLSNKGANHPAIIFSNQSAEESDVSINEDTVGDGFFKLSKSMYENIFTKIYFWDLETLKPLYKSITITDEGGFAETIIDENFEKYSITPTPFTLTKGSGINSVNTFGNWNLKTYVNVAYNENTKASIAEGKKLKLTPTAVAYTASGFPVLEYSGNLSSLTNRFKISFDYNKYSTTSGGGIKFMVHNNGKNYYVLWLSGMQEGKYKWIFNKVENNSIVDTEYGEAYTSYNTNGNGPIHNGGSVEIEYNNGVIAWTIDGYEYINIKYYSNGSYTDNSPFTVEPKNTTIAFGSNSSSTDESRCIYFDNLKLISYISKL